MTDQATADVSMIEGLTPHEREELAQVLARALERIDTKVCCS
jgi:hypothetical protein